jgi:hypothetical protein
VYARVGFNPTLAYTPTEIRRGPSV